MRIENEDNLDFTEAEMKLVKGHLTISKAMKKVIDDDYEKDSDEETKDFRDMVMDGDIQDEQKPQEVKISIHYSFNLKWNPAWKFAIDETTAYLYCI